ncbi:MAG: TonB-dependent receptor plug domain-containing protein [Daejeonella sp.]
MAFLYTSTAFAQTGFKAIIKDSTLNQNLAGVTAIIKDLNLSAKSGTSGQVILQNIPDGKQTIIFSHIGYEKLELSFNFPLTDSLQALTIYLKAQEEELDEVIISSTRTSRTIGNTPTRVETIDFEEIDEKSNMKPANVSMILHESTGIQVQQTSATSGNASIRIQGLDGRYTQLLKDGYASFGNFASGLSILEIPPLDLKQVEIIKGPASTLYGAGAIAGVVNFISKNPKEKAEYSAIINQSNVGQTNIGGFAMQRNNKIGYSILALYNRQNTYDVDKDDFTELPKSDDFSLHPKLFFYPSEKATLIIGNSFSKGDRTGGDIEVIKERSDNDHTYFETNNTLRNTATLDLIQKLSDKNKLHAKTSFSYFNRKIGIPDYQFEGTSYNSYTDVSYVSNLQNQTIIIGGNFIYDQFSERQKTTVQLRDFASTAGGLYAQHTWDISEKLKVESGLRTDIVNYKNNSYKKTEVFLLPRISALFTFNSHFSSRIGGGLGYKTPTLFTEQTETLQYRDLLPLNKVSSERSYGGTADVNYTASITEDIYFSLNQLFFYTRISNSTVLQQDATQKYFFANTNKPVNSAGFETNMKLIFKEDFKLFGGYTFTNAKAEYLTGNQFLPQLPRNKINLALVYEKERNFKLGLEGYFTGNQYLYNGVQTPSFWEFGFMAEKTFGKISLFVNAENFTDIRQSRYKRVVNPPNNNPGFDDIWTHTEGRTFNGGIKLKF